MHWPRKLETGLTRVNLSYRCRQIFEKRYAARTIHVHLRLFLVSIILLMCRPKGYTFQPPVPEWVSFYCIFGTERVSFSSGSPSPGIIFQMKMTHARTRASRTHTHTHARSRTRTRTYTHARTHAHTYTHAHERARTHEHARTHMHARTHKHSHTHAHV